MKIPLTGAVLLLFHTYVYPVIVNAWYKYANKVFVARNNNVKIFRFMINENIIHLFVQKRYFLQLQI